MDYESIDLTYLHNSAKITQLVMVKLGFKLKIFLILYCYWDFHYVMSQSFILVRTDILRFILRNLRLRMSWQRIIIEIYRLRNEKNNSK